MVLDGARADEEVGGDLAVGVAVRRQAGDLRFLRGELVMRIHGPFSGMSARRLQLGPCTLGERVHPEVTEEVVGDLQLLARVKASAFASQPFAVEKVRAGKIDEATIENA